MPQDAEHMNVRPMGIERLSLTQDLHHWPWVCRWIDVTLYLDFEGCSAWEQLPWQGARAVLYTAMHPPRVSEGVQIWVTCVWRERVLDSGLTLPLRSPRVPPGSTHDTPTLFRPFVARSVQEVQAWLSDHDAPGLIGLWVHVWNRRAIGRLLTGEQPWRFNPQQDHLIQVQSGGNSVALPVERSESGVEPRCRLNGRAVASPVWAASAGSPHPRRGCSRLWHPFTLRPAVRSTAGCSDGSGG